MKVIPTDRYRATLKRLRTDNERKRVRMLVDHYTKRTRLTGIDKESGGKLAGKGVRHFHLAEPDTLLVYQITKGALILLAIGTHVEFFGDNETSFIESIQDYLAEDLRYAKIIVECRLMRPPTIH